MSLHSSHTAGRKLHRPAAVPYGLPLPLPEVCELFGEEAEREWAEAFFNLYHNEDERAFAETASMLL